MMQFIRIERLKSRLNKNYYKRIEQRISTNLVGYVFFFFETIEIIYIKMYYINGFNV